MPNQTIAHGCSFTRYEWPCWPDFVPWFNGGITMLNNGQRGSGNETISRAAINSAMKHKQIDHMYLMWSATDRYEVVKLDTNHTAYSWQDDFQWYEFGFGHTEESKHDYYMRHFHSIQQQYYRTLENILRTQLFLERKNINYTMMLFHGNVIKHDTFHSKSEQALYEQIDWSRFVFYNGNGGLWDFGKEKFSNYYKEGNQHPPPIAHYYWVKDVIFKSDLVCTQNELDKLEKYFKE